MTEMSELREKVHDLEVTVARLDERVGHLVDAVDALITQTNPLVAAVAKGKGYIAAVALVAAALGGGLRELVNWWSDRGGTS